MEWKDLIAVAALALGVFNLWWTHFRERIVFKLVNTGPWEFLLVNGGKTDITVLKCQYWVQGSDEKRWYAPPQSRSPTATAPFPLAPGKSMHVSGSFTGDWVGLNHDQGKQVLVNGAEQFRFTSAVKVEWVDVRGRLWEDRISVWEIHTDKVSFRSARALVQAVELSEHWYSKPAKQAITAWSKRASTREDL